MMIIIILIAVFMLPVIYNLLFPLKSPLLDNYFQAGETFISKMEGISQRIIKQEGDKVYTELTLEPNSVGPPEHMHLNFDETATVTKGTITVVLNKQTFKLQAGDRINFKSGDYHSFSNKGENIAVITCDEETDFLPVTFAYALAKFYPIMDSNSKLKMMHFFFKMSMFDDLFDSYVADVPVKAQEVIKKILKPYARVLGYKLYDSKSRP